MPDPGRTLVLGLGNNICGDDQIGLIAVRRLEHSMAELLPVTDFMETTLSGLALIDYFSGYERVFIVDAIMSGKEPGKVHKFVIDGTGVCGIPAAPSPHFSGLNEVFHFSRMVLERFPKVVIILAVEIRSCFDISESLSVEMQGRLDQVVNELGREIRKELNQCMSMA